MQQRHQFRESVTQVQFQFEQVNCGTNTDFSICLAYLFQFGDIANIGYFFQGIAIVSFYFDKKRLPRFVRVFLYTLVALQQLVLLAVIGTE